MNKKEIIEKLKGKLIVSCQALPGEPLYIENDTMMPLMAVAAKRAGAAGIRTNGERDVKEIKKTVDLPVIGLIKKEYEGFFQYITVTMKEIDTLVKAGADIIALDCTMRERGDGKTVNGFIKEIKEKYPDIILMADISTFEEGVNAEKAGVDMVGTTLSGYTPYSEKTDGPDFKLVEKLSKELDIPVIAEGKIHEPQQAKKMIELGAHAVVVGGAITRPLEIAQRFVKAVEN
ncbi:N-acetylmannosamine-6-phosphate 2-epimerase [Pseudoleptotrichia goodfellowii]|uniref:Putative N-acetylmannosamine-6-phosphate 2-epimerase n=1 Tax=Pseudoleptotrichia goodfellowii F0264 TaxID=596323 RepID=D0GNS7_9FUSO|nr:N-acetylmannosamine-6-phosphate 2-epimerase [Pseudoleptotrichia goodfellowii]EEY34281.1 putative N-acetylmannosamine-6-phosphate epimerase [Pseudoleptotrichia goodfellowii F0264]